MQISRDAAALVLLRLNQLAAHILECLLSKLLVRYINGRTDKPGKRSIPIHSWRGNIKHPPIDFIAAPQPVFHRKRLSVFERLREPVENALYIVWMNIRSLPVAIARLEIHAGKRHAPFIQICDLAMRVTHPDQRW